MAEWDRIMPGLLAAGVLTTVDYPTLARYCYYWGQWLDATRIIQASAPVVKAPSGYPMQSPYVIIANRASDMCNKLANELGITPAARAKVSATPRKAAAVKSPFERD